MQRPSRFVTATTTRAGLDGEHQLTLLRSEKAMTDCRPVSLFALQTANTLAEEAGMKVDKRRLRANVYLDLANSVALSKTNLSGGPCA